MKAISCVWGLAPEANAERIRRHCAAAGWELVGEAVKAGIADGTLGWMLCATQCTGAECLLLAPEDLTGLERDLPQLWPRVRALLEDAGIAVLTV